MFTLTGSHPLNRRAAALSINTANLKNHRAKVARSIARAVASLKTLK